MNPLFKYKYGGEWHSSPKIDIPEEITYTKDGEKLSENKALYRNSPFAQNFWFSVLKFIPNFDLPFYPQIIEKWDVFYASTIKKQANDYVEYNYNYEETEHGTVQASRYVTYSGTLSISIDEIHEMWDSANQDSEEFDNLLADHCSDQVNDYYSEGNAHHENLEIDEYEFQISDTDFQDRTIETPDATTIIEDYLE
jgi:hypothetical protein